MVDVVALPSDITVDTALADDMLEDAACGSGCVVATLLVAAGAVAFIDTSSATVVVVMVVAVCAGGVLCDAFPNPVS